MTERRQHWLLFAVVLALFGTSALSFEARVTDVSAMRVLDGDVPYRDFWTMYAPGSYLVLALAFAMVGRELIVSNLLGLLASAGAVTAFFNLARKVSGPWPSLAAAAVVAAAFYGTNYHSGLTSYAPGFLLILHAVHLAAPHVARQGSTWAIRPGLWLGVAIVFKHDVAGYAALAMAVAIVAARHRPGAKPWLAPVGVLAAATTVAPGMIAAWLLAAGAGPDLWNDLVRFPLTDFPSVRPEFLPLVPRWRPVPLDLIQGLVRWGIVNLPLYTAVAGVLTLWRRWRSLDDRSLFLALFAAAAFALHWVAAHVQLNTHAISLPAWSLLLLGAASRGGVTLRPARRGAAIAAVLLLVPLFMARPLYLLFTREGATAWVALPGLWGIRVTITDAEWMRGLSEALVVVAPRDAPLQLVGHRNDINIFAESAPYWLTTRRPATRHHELHPGITDTEPYQRQMLAAMIREPRPVLVREYRFTDAAIDAEKAKMRVHVAIGSTLMDQWIQREYRPWRRFGRYELLKHVEH